ncbi:MAG: dethiobiotin synthase [Chloroflexota bacterium]
MKRGIFITGTDTGIGKTVVTAGILRWLRRQGVDAVPMKPVQTGARREGRRLISPDLEFCLAASGIHPASGEEQLMLPYAYEPACSPHLAGRLAGKYPEILQIIKCAEKLLQKHQLIVVEGAGGIMVPLNENVIMLDLMKEMAYPVVLVSRFGLGTINHTLLSVNTLRAAGLNLLGVVFNRTEPTQSGSEFIEADNPEVITRFGNVPVLGKLRHFENLSPERQDIWQHFEADMPGLKCILDELRR